MYQSTSDRRKCHTCIAPRHSPLITNQMTVSGVRARRPVPPSIVCRTRLSRQSLRTFQTLGPLRKGKKEKRMKRTKKCLSAWQMAHGRSIKNLRDISEIGKICPIVLHFVFTKGSTHDPVYVDLPTNFISAKTAAPP